MLDGAQVIATLLVIIFKASVKAVGTVFFG